MHIALSHNPFYEDEKKYIMKKLLDVFSWHEGVNFVVAVDYKEPNTLSVTLHCPYVVTTSIDECKRRNRVILESFRSTGIKGTIIEDNLDSKVLLDFPEDFKDMEKLFTVLKLKNIQD